MAGKSQQSFSNHARYDPPFHFFIVPVFAITLVALINRAIHHPNLHSVWMAVVAFAALTLAFKARIYGLRVQDRLIRLEERLRILSLDPSFAPGISQLSESQLIGLRFASDSEVAELARRALAENLQQKEIKRSIKVWRADYFRV